MMIFKRKNKKLSLTDHAPPGTLNEVSENGWINADIFLNYIKHFVKHVRPSKSFPVLIVVDGHKTHTKNIQLINYAEKWE